MKTRPAIPAVVALAVAACSSPVPPETPSRQDAPSAPLAGARPNVLLILLDDLGYDDLGVHGNDIVETPHIDALARESVRFESFYVTPVCATTRAALLTGRHHLRPPGRRGPG